MKLKKARRYTITRRNETLVIDVPESPTHPAEVMFLKWAKQMPWVRIFILTSNCN